MTHVAHSSYFTSAIEISGFSRSYFTYLCVRCPPSRLAAFRRTGRILLGFPAPWFGCPLLRQPLPRFCPRFRHDRLPCTNFRPGADVRCPSAVVKEPSRFDPCVRRSTTRPTKSAQIIPLSVQPRQIGKLPPYPLSMLASSVSISSMVGNWLLKSSGTLHRSSVV